MSETYSQDQYERAKAAVSSGGVPPDKVPIVRQRITQYEDDRARGYLPAPAAKPVAEERPVGQLDAAQKQGYDIDLSRPQQDVIRPIAQDPRRAQLVEKIRQATRDEALPNESKLKVFNDPPDYRPPQVKNPFSALPMPPKDTQYFYEPSVSEFKAVLKSGAMADQLSKEFPGVSDPLKLIDKDLEGSSTFRAYRDAAWKHALADAIKTQTPISRVKHSKELGSAESLQAQALDPVVAAATGALSSATGGLADPAIRLIAPEGAEAERRSRMRNPEFAFGGELLGALSPSGLTSQVAKGASRILGKLGLGATGLGGAARGIGAAATTGAVDANTRAIAQSASDAIDAGDSAVDAAHRIYAALTPEQAIPRTLEGAGAGATLGAGAELIGAGLNGISRKIVGSDSHLPILNQGLVSGVKMSPTGEPVLPADLLAEVKAARSKRADADVLIADRSVEPMASQRLLEQEAAARRATQQTEQAREKLKGSTVSLKPAGEEIVRMAEEMPGATHDAARLKTSLRRYGRKIRGIDQASPAELDALIEEAARTAKAGDKEPDPFYTKASAILRQARDELKFEEPTSVDNYAIRNEQGDVKPVSDYGGMKTRQSTEMDIQKFDNRQMGLPPELKPAPVRVGPVSEEDAGRFLASHPNYQQVKQLFNQDRAIASDLERSDFSRPKSVERTVGALQSQYGANKALIDAVDSGYGYVGTVYRGARMSPEQISEIVSNGAVKNKSLWSTSKSPDHALAFAKKGNSGEPVLFEIDGSSGVSLDAVPGLNTFDEVAVPTGRNFKLTDSYRNKDGVLVMKLSDGTRGPLPEEATALAEGTRPKANLDAFQRKEFSDKILGSKDPANFIATEKLQQLASRAGIPENIPNIQRLHDSQNWKQLLGGVIQGISATKTGPGGAYLRKAQLLRLVPSLKSLGGGLPTAEATEEATSLVDKFLSEAVPEWKPANLRGGQSARPVGALGSRKKEQTVKDGMTADEAQAALVIIKNLLAMQGQ